MRPVVLEAQIACACEAGSRMEKMQTLHEIVSGMRRLCSKPFRLGNRGVA